MVWDGMRALDYVLTRAEVDAARIAVTGTSGGGFQSTWLGALDERVAVVMPSCFVTALPMRMANRIFDDPDSDPEQDPPGLVAAGIDHPGLLLLAYPRPVHVAAAVKDFFPIEGTRQTLREVAALYERFGKGDRIALTEGYHGHQYSAENQEAAFAFLDRAFGRPARRGLDPVSILDPAALRCTSSGQVRPDLGGRSLLEVVREIYRERKGHESQTLGDVYRGSGDPGIRAWPVVAHAGPVPRHTIAWESRGRSTVGDAVVDRYLLHHSGLLVPLLNVHRQAPPGRAVLRVSLAGKLRPEDWSEVDPLLAAGDGVLSFDGRGLGENQMRYKAASIDDPELVALPEDAAYVSPVSGVLANHAYNALLTGRPYFLEMIEDAEVVLRFAREKLGATRLAVTGRGDAGLLAAGIAAAVPDVELLPSSSAPFSWAQAVEEMRETWPIHYLMPGGAYLRLAR
jgi:hypothetical protein